MTTCLRCRENGVKTRGLCQICYKWLLGRVKAGETTWGKLEAAGLAVKPGKKKLGGRHR